MAEVKRSDSLVFLGSGGARIVVARQLRASGGIWFCLDETEFLVDPGPGALVRLTGSLHRLSPSKLSAILLSHRHLDHAGDVNNMIEAMTMGGTEKRGVLYAPSDALEGDDPVVLRYLRPFLEGIVLLKPEQEYRFGRVRFTCPVRHRHRGEVYGFRFEVPGLVVSYVADTAYFPELAGHYQADVLIMNVVRLKPSGLDHLHVPDALELVRAVKPKLALLTHFGMTVIKAKPWEVAREMSSETGVNVVAASDGKRVDLSGFRESQGRPR